jgi:hypothetical protein
VSSFNQGEGYIFFINMHYFAHKMNFGREHGHFVGSGFSALVGGPFVKLIYFLHA